MSSISRGTSRFKLDAKWRIAAAAAGIALLMCGALAFTVRSHAKSVRTSAEARIQREDMLATERASVGAEFVITLPLAKDARRRAPVARGDVAASFR